MSALRISCLSRLIRIIYIHRRCRSSVAEEMKVLGVVLDRRMSFRKHVAVVARSCNYRAHCTGRCRIRYLLITKSAQTLAYSLILSRIDYCNAVLHGAPTGTVQKLQRVQNSAARVVPRLRGDGYCTSCTGCQSSSGLYKLAVLTYKVRSATTPD